MENTSELTQLLVTLTHMFQVGNPIGHRNLTLVPLFGQAAGLEYILAAEALQDDTLVVTEVSESGNVNVLLVENKGKKRVLLLDGEELVGAKQNRILNTTILIEAQTTQKIPVSCVEQGRWRHVSAQFAAGMYAPPQVRSNKNRQVTASYKRCGQAISDQGEVWQNVEEMACSLKAVSPTGAMRDAFDQRAADFDSYVKALPYPDGARGVMAAVSGRFVALDALDRPDTFKSIWNRLVTGYAVDAVCHGTTDYKPFSEKSAQFILDSIRDCSVSAFEAVGVGRELRFQSDQILGQALVVGETLIHMSVFPNERQNRDVEDSGSHIMPPSFRGRPRRPADSV